MDIDEAMEKFADAFKAAKRGDDARKSLYDLYGAALARIAALEAQRNHYQELWVDVGYELGQFADDLTAVLKLDFTDDDDEDIVLPAIVAKVAQLATQWRSVSEPPVKSGRYLIWNRQYPQFGVEMQFYDISTASWYTNDAGEQSIDYPTHWQPLPAPPQDTPASGRHEGEE